MYGAPPQSIGCVNPSRWTHSDLFVTWLRHFIKHAGASLERPKILIIDGHHSHKSLAAVNIGRENGVYMITLPPHSTHKMQPLDVTIFKSFKSSYASVCDSWMLSKPGKRISIYQVASLFGQTYMKCATPDKAVNGLKKMWHLARRLNTIPRRRLCGRRNHRRGSTYWIWTPIRSRGSSNRGGGRMYQQPRQWPSRWTRTHPYNRWHK